MKDRLWSFTFDGYPMGGTMIVMAPDEIMAGRLARRALESRGQSRLVRSLGSPVEIDPGHDGMVHYDDGSDPLTH